MAPDESKARIQAVLDAGGPDVVVQPVADLRRGTIMGDEALARFSAEPRRTPDLWFVEAWTVGLGLPLELAAIRNALALLPSLPSDAYIALNASPRTLESPELLALVTAAGGHRVVMELTEHAAVDNYERVTAAVGQLRSQGARLAIDDAGAGFASFQHVIRLLPDIIKLDRSLTFQIEGDPVRAALAAALVTFAGSLGAPICAEGIETLEQLGTLQKLGVGFGQGYFFARPGPLPLPELPTGMWPCETVQPPASRGAMHARSSRFPVGVMMRARRGNADRRGELKARAARAIERATLLQARAQEAMSRARAVRQPPRS